MDITRAQLTEHIRRLFRLGGETPALRHAWLDAQSNPVQEAELSDGAGLRIASSSANGAAVAFAPAANGSRSAVFSQTIIATLRPYADAKDLDEALSLAPPRVTVTRPDFSGLRL